ncbi:MAG: 30S ribosomal protein S11 [Candidatus Pacebacteria bacterium]|nr:30S ribosomal protein S11 [Candidatus Paceibacterota bacterium]NUQ57471.1 30S ribosomal protein S11 [Candidatus Paceibacter sp.]
MGKKKIITKEETAAGSAKETKESKAPAAKSAKAKITSGVLRVQSTYNNTTINVTDKSGNSLFWSSSGTLGFRGAKKGTPFASAKVAELLADKAIDAGIKDVDVVVKGVGAGRESAIRAFASKGIEITSIKDVTPVPHNGPKPPKPRRV